jgi:hypothetical protein
LHYARHLLGLGITDAEVQLAATAAIRAIYDGGGAVLGWFEGFLNIGGVSLIYRAFPIAVGEVIEKIVVGTVFPGP